MCENYKEKGFSPEDTQELLIAQGLGNDMSEVIEKVYGTKKEAPQSFVE